MSRDGRPHENSHQSESRRTARAAVLTAMTDSRAGEAELIAGLKKDGIAAAAADFGGSFPGGLSRMLEAAVVAAKREGVIAGSHAEEGAVAGACHEALTQLMDKASGFNVGGKLGIARLGDHLSVAVFLSIGLVHLNDVAIGLAHRYI